MGIMKGIVWKNATSSTELPRDFCAGIGPLQLGVVLVFFISVLSVLGWIWIALSVFWRVLGCFGRSWVVFRGFRVGFVGNVLEDLRLVLMV